MENNEVMMNSSEEIMETAAEELTKTDYCAGLKKVSTVGLAMIAGALTYKFVVVPAAAKFKNWRENRKTVVNQQQDDAIDGEVREVDEETEDDSL